MKELSIEKLLKNKDNPKSIFEAFEFAKKSYEGRKRFNGEDYIEHALRVALFLDKMGVDEKTIIIAILHDVIDDKPQLTQELELKEIEKIFDVETANLIKKIFQLRKIRFSLKENIKNKNYLDKERIESLRKTFVALAGDIRVLLIELTSRLDGLGHLKSLPPDYQRMYALETLEIFSPIANRLGLGQIKRLLEDESFMYLFPEKYKWLEQAAKETYEEREKYIKKFIPKLNKILKKERIKFVEINYRTKSRWSTYRKLVKKDMNIKKIHDLIAIRIITKDVRECYKAIGILHKYYRPISGEINDYIAKPKINGYRSLHTSLFLDKDHISEIQIRTQEMHSEAEYGICAHWSYKEKIDLKKEGDKYAWVNGAFNFWESFKINFFENFVFVFTPKGDIIELPKDATPVDFAYAVHSDIGNHCEAAKIAGKIIPLSYMLQNGDVVEIITNKNKKPSLDWLKFVKTNHARNHIKKTIEIYQTGFKLPIPHFIKKKVLEITERFQKRKEEQQKIIRGKPGHIIIAGQKGMLVNIAKCCNPKSGDEVKAYITKFRATVLHKANCQNLHKLAEVFPEKIIDANWE